MTASQNESNRMILMALLTEQAHLAKIEETIRVLTRSLANEHGIPASYPPVE
jgi:hypothetical protein